MIIREGVRGRERARARESENEAAINYSTHSAPFNTHSFGEQQGGEIRLLISDMIANINTQTCMSTHKSIMNSSLVCTLNK